MKIKALLLILVPLASLLSLSLVHAQIVCPQDTMINANSFGLGQDKKINDSIIYSLELNSFPTYLGTVDDANYIAVKMGWRCDYDAKPNKAIPDDPYIVGFIERKFVRTQDTATCYQHIGLRADEVFTEANIAWPQDLTLSWSEYSQKKVRNDPFWDGTYATLSDESYKQMMLG